MNFLEPLYWRYASKRMNGNIVPKEKVDEIIEAARLAPTSIGLQPFKIIAISDKELLKKIQPIANNQAQIIEASHLLVFAAWENITEDLINQHFDNVIKERQLPAESMDGMKINMVKKFTANTAEQNFLYASKQAFLPLGVAIYVAAAEKIDATPMEGFNPEALDELLNLKEKGLRSVVLLALGYRDEQTDWLLKLKKVRKPLNEFLIELN